MSLESKCHFTPRAASRLSIVGLSKELFILFQLMKGFTEVSKYNMNIKSFIMDGCVRTLTACTVTPLCNGREDSDSPLSDIR